MTNLKNMKIGPRSHMFTSRHNILWLACSNKKAQASFHIIWFTLKGELTTSSVVTSSFSNIEPTAHTRAHDIRCRDLSTYKYSQQGKRAHETKCRDLFNVVFKPRATKQISRHQVSWPIQLTQKKPTASREPSRHQVSWSLKMVPSTMFLTTKQVVSFPGDLPHVCMTCRRVAHDTSSKITFDLTPSVVWICCISQ